MKRFFILFFAVISLSCLLLVSCTKETAENTGKESESESGADRVPGDIVLVSGGECKFVITYADDSTASLQRVLDMLGNKFQEVAGVSPRICADSDAPEGEVRIRVGDPTSLGASNGVCSEIPYFGNAVMAYGGDIYICAYDSNAVVEAVNTFSTGLGDMLTDGSIKIPEDYLYVKNNTSKYPVGNVPYIEGGENPSLFDCDDGYRMVLVSGVDENEFSAYCDKVAGSGYTLTAQNDMNGNLFRTYVNDDNIMLHTYWIEHSSEVRAVVAKNAVMAADDTGGNNSLCTPVLRQLRAAPLLSGYNEGMGYVIRLGDGRFIIIDGGYYRTECAEEIYNSLRELALDPDNIVVASWYISHAHDDHFGAFRKFAEVYSSDPKIKIESFMYNLCITDEQTEFADGSGGEKIRNAVKTYYPDSIVYKPLTGQVYKFSDTSIEIFFTMEDFMPSVIQNEPDATPENPKRGDFNVESVVSRFDINGKTFFVMADTTTVCCDEMCARYKNYMKSDYVQMSHHGLSYDSPRARNATKEIYGFIRPDYALLPCSEERYSDRINYDVNAYLRSIVRKVYCAGMGQVTFELK